MLKFEVNDHESSLLPEGRKWKLVWADEFDGTELDRTKWDYRLYMMGKRHRTWGNEGVELDGQSHAVFSVYEKDGEICSCQLQTGYNYMDEPSAGADENSSNSGIVWPIAPFRKPKFLHRYGYYECRCRLQQKSGWWSAFWMQSPMIGCCPDARVAGIEVDIMESFHPGRLHHHCNHYGGYSVQDHRMVTAGHGMDLDVNVWHTFGLLWTPEGYTYYVDGEVDGHIAGPVSQTPEFLLISTEVNGYRTKQQCATEEARAAVGDTFMVDYVRVFDWLQDDD